MSTHILWSGSPHTSYQTLLCLHGNRARFSHDGLVLCESFPIFYKTNNRASLLLWNCICESPALVYALPTLNHKLRSIWLINKSDQWVTFSTSFSFYSDPSLHVCQISCRSHLLDRCLFCHHWQILTWPCGTAQLSNAWLYSALSFDLLYLFWSRQVKLDNYPSCLWVLSLCPCGHARHRPFLCLLWKFTPVLVIACEYLSVTVYAAVTVCSDSG